MHRIGRTARAGSAGTAVIFLTPPEVSFVRLLEERRVRIKQDDMDSVLEKLLGPLSKHNNIQGAATALQNEFESLVLEDKKFYAKACKGMFRKTFTNLLQLKYQKSLLCHDSYYWCLWNDNTRAETSVASILEWSLTL